MARTRWSIPGIKAGEGKRYRVIEFVGEDGVKTLLRDQPIGPASQEVLFCAKEGRHAMVVPE